MINSICVESLTKALETGKTVQVFDRSDAPKKLWKTAYRLDDIKRRRVTAAVYVSRNNGSNWVVSRSEYICQLRLDSCVKDIIQAHFEGCEVIIK